ncbi:Arm DNA-binding domain-containing protein [Sulfurimonas sp.]|uniref:Arm DNA-binding domain-containing protein n=1 Tax=Sulfurimonas sp. TaxID=2022749 RepID=UPI002AB24BB8|nr:Arm DNA-binding domain-containing protein [Sulfurimonas sp.]
MARTITPLTDTKIKTTKPKEKDYKLSDGGGLYLLVTKAGGKHWKLKYRFDNKEQKLSLGAYPSVSLSKARELREKYKTEIAK